MSLDFATLRAANVARCIEKFHPEGLQAWSLTDWACAMAGEAGEACNIVKKLKRLETIGHKSDWDPVVERDALLASLGHELADIVIYVDLLAAAAGFNLGDCVAFKFNQVSDKVGASQLLERCDEPKDKEPLAPPPVAEAPPVDLLTRELITVTEFARLLRVSKRTVIRMQADGRIPAPVRITAAIVRWRVRDVQRYLDSLSTTEVHPDDGSEEDGE